MTFRKAAAALVLLGFCSIAYASGGAGYAEDVFQNYLKRINLVDSSGSSINRSSLFWGDGSDGSLVFDGTTTILGIVPSGNAYTLSRAVYGNNITVNSGVTIHLANWEMLASGIFTINGTIDCSGGNASANTAGSGVTLGSFSAGVAGVAGSTAAFTSGAGLSGGGTLLSGAGGGGGLSNGTHQNAGTVSALNGTNIHLIRQGQIVASWGSNALPLCGGGQAGAGSGDGTHAGGGSGGGAGIVHLRGRTITCGSAVLIQAIGGNGGNGTAGTAGGGGGGPGGGVLIYANTYTGTALVPTTNVLVSGGTHGVGSTTAGNGTDGVAGNIFIITVP